MHVGIPKSMVNFYGSAEATFYCFSFSQWMALKRTFGVSTAKPNIQVFKLLPPPLITCASSIHHLEWNILICPTTNYQLQRTCHSPCEAAPFFLSLTFVFHKLQALIQSNEAFLEYSKSASMAHISLISVGRTLGPMYIKLMSIHNISPGYISGSSHTLTLKK